MSTAVPAPNPCGPALDSWCARWLPERTGPVAVAYSAGADSTALLLAARERWPGQVIALHVHHGLQAAADHFESSGRALCERLDIPFTSVRVDATRARGQSPEDAARVHRYAALSRMSQLEGAACVLLGQHADDQAETVVLALSRGAGLPGLSAMAERFERHGVVFGRPLLALSALSLRGWLMANEHPFVNDPTNSDTRFTRNRIRAGLLPAWEACFPGFRPMLSRSARHAAQAQALLDDLARIDLERTGAPPAVEVLRHLSRERQANALRHWLRYSAGAVASTAQMEELLEQIADCTTRGHRIHIKVADGFVVREGDSLGFVALGGHRPI